MVLKVESKRSVYSLNMLLTMLCDVCTKGENPSKKAHNWLKIGI